jgi:hypothetical protein
LIEVEIVEGTYHGQPFRIVMKERTDTLGMLGDDEVLEVLEFLDKGINQI